jgi:hypothetical protein
MAETPDTVFKRGCCRNATGISATRQAYITDLGRAANDISENQKLIRLRAWGALATFQPHQRAARHRLQRRLAGDPRQFVERGSK